MAGDAGTFEIACDWWQARSEIERIYREVPAKRAAMLPWNPAALLDSAPAAESAADQMLAEITTNVPCSLKVFEALAAAICVTMKKMESAYKCFVRWDGWAEGERVATVFNCGAATFVVQPPGLLGE